MSRKSDPRIHRTRDRLGDALIALMIEKPFDEITVQQVLDRAGIGRSTFYVHYRDKEDLFVSDIDEFWELMSTWLLRSGDRSERLAPVRELFAHVADSREIIRAFSESGRLHEVIELGRLHFARAIAERLAQSPRAADVRDPEATAHMLAGALFSLLEWWIARDEPPDPERMDKLFHSLVAQQRER